MITPRSLISLIGGVALTGCATERTHYPSLMPRAAERVGFDEPVVARSAPVAPDPVLDARLRELGAQLDTVARGFDTDARKARTAVAASGARTVGGEAWLSAQAAVAVLDDWRSQATGLASEVETLAGERLGTNLGAYPSLDALQARATTEAARETTAIAGLSATLPTP